MSGKGFAFFHWCAHNKLKYEWDADHGWDCGWCRNDWYLMNKPR